MNILDNVIILLLIIGAFIAGKAISDNYHKQTESEYEYVIKVLAAGNGLGYIASPQKKKQVPIGQPFMDKRSEHGRATQMLRQTGQ